MFAFPWLVLILVLVLAAVVLIEATGALRALVAEHHLHLVRFSLRILAVVTFVELVVVLVWGLFLRPR